MGEDLSMYSWVWRSVGGYDKGDLLLLVTGAHTPKRKSGIIDISVSYPPRRHCIYGSNPNYHHYLGYILQH
jgi:hypothetical protein